MCSKLFRFSVFLICLAAAESIQYKGGTTQKAQASTIMGKKGYNTTKSPRRVIDWTPGVEVNRMELDGEEVVFRVINGREGKLGEVPYQLSFRQRVPKRKDLFASFCGGTLITATEGLTAAHCFHKASLCESCCHDGKADEETLSRAWVVAGVTSTFSYYHGDDSPAHGQWRRLRNVFYSTRYQFPDHDFACAFFTQPFVFNNYVAPIKYAVRDVDYTGSCLLSGFGRLKSGHPSVRLELAELRVLSKRQCNSIHRKSMRDFICTSDQISDIGKGDSGGPLVCRNTGDPNEGPNGVLVGIVSGKSRTRKSGSFFVRVTSYMGVLKRCYERNTAVTIAFLNINELFVCLIVIVLFNNYLLT